MTDNRQEGELFVKIQKVKKVKTIRQQRIEFDEQRIKEDEERRQKCDDWIYQHPLQNCFYIFCCIGIFFTCLILFLVFL